MPISAADADPSPIAPQEFKSLILSNQFLFLTREIFCIHGCPQNKTPTGPLAELLDAVSAVSAVAAVIAVTVFALAGLSANSVFVTDVRGVPHLLVLLLMVLLMLMLMLLSRYPFLRRIESAAALQRSSYSLAQVTPSSLPRSFIQGCCSSQALIAPASSPSSIVDHTSAGAAAEG